MNLTSYILEQALRQLKLPESSLKQFRIASGLSDVGGNGFPKELFQLSAPLVVRGLLNFGTLQMKSDWIYPYWVHRQLDPKDPSFVPRSQNPLLLNITHRNWTALGSPNGLYEAVVDPRGLVTPLPREWSLDVWVVAEDQIIFPSVAANVIQHYDTNAPRLTTVTRAGNLELRVEHFVDSTNRNVDVLFQRAYVGNAGEARIAGNLCIAIRPFNPEGVAPVHSIEFRQGRFAYVDKILGVAFAKTPDWTATSNADNGDTAMVVRTPGGGERTHGHSAIECRRGLANAVAGYGFALDPQQEFSVDCSVALNSEKSLRNHPTKQTWRVSFEKRKEQHTARWAKELAVGATFTFADQTLQDIFDASRLALLQLQDDEFISPGPFLYHHFWYRDAAPMVRALDVLGFAQRAQEVIDGFRDHMRADGFFRGPDGEWDSNGAVMWSVYRHYLLTRSRAWLQAWYPSLLRGGHWIESMRKRTPVDAKVVPGLMPPGLSAEHLGTVDQYYWDSFWSLGGLRSLVFIATALGKSTDLKRLKTEEQSFTDDIRSSILSVTETTGQQLVPATPTRAFDQSAIGSVVSVYPLQILGDLPHPANTVREIDRKFVNDRGFFHPIIHSGYNPYLTLQLAHSYLLLGDVNRAWEIAETILRQTRSPFSLPEAIHPTSGGGAMGDGHHGWAAAEIVLFLRDCLVREFDGGLMFFGGANSRLVQCGKNLLMENVPTDYGTVGIRMEFESSNRCVVQFRNEFFPDARPATLKIQLPFATKKIAASSPNDILRVDCQENATVIRCASVIKTLFIEW